MEPSHVHQVRSVQPSVVWNMMEYSSAVKRGAVVADIVWTDHSSMTWVREANHKETLRV